MATQSFNRTKNLNSPMKILNFSLLSFVFAFVLAVSFISCKKEFSIENGGQLASGDWQFKDSSKEYKGLIDTAYIDASNSTHELHLIGTSNDGQQQFHLVMYADSFKVGTYKASAFQSSFDYNSGVNIIYEAGQLNGEFIVKITSINKSLVTGTFSGNALKNDSEIVQLTNGLFKAILQGPIENPTSVGVLGDSLGNCKPIVVEGNYTQGNVMNPQNTIQVQVDVAKAGTYYIYTNPVNGINFSGEGNVQEGTQIITLNAAGIPESSGDQNFVLHYGNSQCGFTINFQPGAAPSGDYFPKSKNSNWTYTNDFDNTETSYTKVSNDPKVVNGTSYTVYLLDGILPTEGSDLSDTAFIFRKNGNDYYDLLDYSGLLNFDQPVRAETIFLKDNLGQGSTWDGPNVTGTIQGVPLTIHIKYTIVAKSVALSIGRFDFPDVIKVKSELYSGNTALGLTSENWYAKNVGLIYSTSGSQTYNIADYQVF